MTDHQFQPTPEPIIRKSIQDVFMSRMVEFHRMMEKMVSKDFPLDTGKEVV